MTMVEYGVSDQDYQHSKLYANMDVIDVYINWI